MKRPSLVSSALIVMSGYFITKIVGVAREPLIARTFGASEALDAYYAAFNLPELLHTLIAGGALTSVLIPLFTEALTQRGQTEAWRFGSAVINIVLLTISMAAALSAWFAPQLVACCLASGFAPAQQALTVELMRLILLSTIIFALAGVLMGILNAQQHFVSPAFAPALYNLGIIGGALFLAPRFGIHGLVYGVIIGALLHLASHLPPLFKHGVQYQLILVWRDPAITQMLSLMWPRILALGVVEINSLVATNLASRLGEGSVTALNLAWQVMQIPETIIGTAVAIAIFPTLARHAAAGQLGQLRETMISALRVILLLSIPALVGLLLLGRPAVQLLFQGGRFSAGATNAVVYALQFYALALLGHSLLEVAARVFYARKDTRTPLLAALLAMALNIALAYALLDWLALGGIALANALAVSIEVGLLLWVVQEQLRTPNLPAKLRWRPDVLILQTLIAGGGMAGIILFTPTPSHIIALLVGGVASVVYFGVLWAMRVVEVREVAKWLSGQVIKRLGC